MTAKAIRPIFSLLDVFADILKALAKKTVRLVVGSFLIGVILTAMFTAFMIHWIG